jgi:hypothetical protein
VCCTDEVIPGHEVHLLRLLRPIWETDVAATTSRRRRFDPPTDLDPLTGRNHHMNSFDAPATTRRLHRVRPRDVADLTVIAAYPCISVLMPTDPAPRMTSPDAKRLHGLVEDVDQQLREHGIPAQARLMRKLASRVQQVAGQPTDRSLAIYVSLAVSRTFWLSVPVTARAVVEHTFATRPLVTSLHRTPPHVLLLLHPTCAHLYQGADGGLRLVGSRDSFQGPRPVRVPQQGHGDLKEAAADQADGFLRAVDHLLGRYRAEHPSPLVLGGSPHVVDRFRALSRNLHRLAGRIPPTRGEIASDLARASSEVVEHYLRSRREEALSNLRTALATRPVDVASGMAACWHAVHQRVPGMLLVEHDFVSPGRPEDYAVPTPGPRPRSVAPRVHDLVDDLIEVVIMRGGQLALVDNGDLAAHGRVALLSRPTNAARGSGPRIPPG